MAEFKDELDHHKPLMRDRVEDIYRENALAQQRQDLADLNKE